MRMVKKNTTASASRRSAPAGAVGWLVIVAALAIPAVNVQAGDISLAEAIEEALQGNPRVLAATAQTRRAEAAVIETRSTLLPDIVAIGEYTRSEEPGLVYPMRGTPSPMDPLTFDDQIYTGVLRLDVPILNLSALSGLQASRFGVDTGRARKEEAEQRTIAAVTELFIQAGQIEDNLTLMEGHIRALQRRQEELRTLAREGRVPPSSVAEVESTLQSVQADRLELEFRHDEVAYRLAVLLGTDRAVTPVIPVFAEPPAIPGSASAAGQNVPAGGSGGSTPAGESVVTGGSTPAAGAVVSGPATRAAEAQYYAALAGRDGARYSFAPRVAGYATQTARSGAEEIDFQSDWALGLTVTVPLLTGGERIARLRSAEADVEAAVHNRDAARREERTERRRLEGRWENAAARKELLASATANQERSVSAVETRFREGRGSLSDLLAEETTLLELRMHHRSTRYDQLLSYIAYAELLGELSPTLIQNLTEE
jgi:outer membrane protein TolC